MSYEPHTWECDELITPEKLNHIEEGIANSGNGNLVLRETHVERDGSCVYRYFDHTWQEVCDAILQGRTVVVVSSDALMHRPSLFYIMSVDVIEGESDETEYIAMGTTLTVDNNRAVFTDNMLLNANPESGYLYYAQCVN